MGVGILTDVHYMLASIDEAIFGMQRNPLYGGQVGCVLVGKDGRIVSQAHNNHYGGVRMHMPRKLY